jgi:hypothetical protein
MANAEHAPDILSALPLWVQVAANLGMFVVAVATAAWGFATKRVGFVSDPHFAEGVQFHTLGDDIKEGVAALESVAESLKAMLAIQQAHQHEDEIEREVQRRLKDARPKSHAENMQVTAQRGLK